MPTKNSKILSVRVKNDIIRQIEERLGKKKPTINSWLGLAIKESLRPHRKKGEK